MAVILSCCGGVFINEKQYHEEWCPTHIQTALSFLDPNAAGVRERAEIALTAIMERDGRTKAVTIPDLLPLARRLYRSDSVGCCLHDPLSPGGPMDPETIRGCIVVAENRGHAHCETLARVLLRLTDAQRERLATQARQ